MMHSSDLRVYIEGRSIVFRYSFQYIQSFVNYSKIVSKKNCYTIKYLLIYYSYSRTIMDTITLTKRSKMAQKAFIARVFKHCSDACLTSQTHHHLHCPLLKLFPTRALWNRNCFLVYYGYGRGCNMAWDSNEIYFIGSPHVPELCAYFGTPLTVLALCIHCRFSALFSKLNFSLTTLDSSLLVYYAWL